MRVMVNVGDTVAHDQPVLELETDKATIEVPSTVAGTVKEVRVKKGDKVKVGAVVLTVDEAAVSGNGSGQKAAKAEEKPEPPAAEAKPAESKPAESKPAETRPDAKVLSMPPRGAQEASAPAPPPPQRAETTGERGPLAPASPAVRRLAREIGVNIDEVQGSGPVGRISQEDVKEHARRILSSV